MNFDDDLPAFLADFGVAASITPGINKQVIFNKPDAGIFGEMQVTHDFSIRYITTDFTSLHDGVAIVVDGGNYKIKGEPLVLTDGRFSLATLRTA